MYPFFESISLITLVPGQRLWDPELCLHSMMAPAPLPACFAAILAQCLSFKPRQPELLIALSAKALSGKPSSLIPMPGQQDLGKQIDLILASEGTAKLSSSTLMGAADCTGISGLWMPSTREPPKSHGGQLYDPESKELEQDQLVTGSNWSGKGESLAQAPSSP